MPNTHRFRSGIIVRWLLLAIVVVVLSGGAWWSLRRLGGNDVDVDRLLGASAPAARTSPETVAKIEAFCGDCHGVPRPNNYPRDDWYGAVRRGYSYYAGSGRTDLDPPIPHDVEVYYRSRAAKMPDFPKPVAARTALRMRFSVEKLACSPYATMPPAISCIRWTRLQPRAKPVFLVADMREGSVLAVPPDHPIAGIKQLARVGHPCHVEPCDLDQDGLTDLLVADLGSTKAFDHDHGRIIWLKCKPDGSYEPRVLLAKLGRVADVCAVDVDSDGDMDCIVAEFGARRTGNILLLRNIAPAGAPPRMEVTTLDPRPGSIHVPVCDLNGDQHPDFIALISQEYEAVDAFLGLGNGKFQREPLWSGPDPAFGSSGIQLVDLDQDGDTDVLLTNGDTFDDGFIKPSHGVHWLENRGPPNFVHHRLAYLPGAYRALAGDIDNDGDLDVIAATWVSPNVKPNAVTPAQLVSVICLEQVAAGKFAWHTLETGVPYHAVMAMADFDADGDLDFAVGMNGVQEEQKMTHWMDIWWNQLVPSKRTSE